MEYSNDKDEGLGEKMINAENEVVVSFTRFSSSKGMRLFGSSVPSNAGVTLSISTAQTYRGFGKSRHGDHKKIIEVVLTPAQLSELITTMNIGCGVPGTMTYKDGKDYPIPDSPTENELINREYQKHMKEVFVKVEGYIVNLRNLLKLPNVSKKNINNALNDLEGMKRELVQNMPFMHHCFAESMERTVQEAKAEVDHFITGALSQLPAEVLELKSIKDIFPGATSIKEMGKNSRQPLKLPTKDGKDG